MTLTKYLQIFVLLAAVLFGASVKAEDVVYEWRIKPRLSMPPLSPDCFIDKDLLLVNDQFPGPELRAKLGDTVHIRWINESPSAGVSIHYHGNLMKNQPYADGTGGASTCVVGPMQTFEHTFVADNAGTHYYHGHTSMELMDGLLGIMIVEDPDDPEEEALKDLYDEERVVLLQDWYHKSGPNLRTSLDSGVWIGFPQSLLINGKGRFDPCVEDSSLPGCDEEGCTSDKYIVPILVEAQKTYLFQIVNAAGLLSLTFAIADHKMTVVRADGTYVEPFEVTSLEINVGQRYSVLVTADQEPNRSYWASVSGGRDLIGYSYLQYGDSLPPTENSTMPTHLEDGPTVDSMLFSKNINSHPNADILAEDINPVRTSVLLTAQSIYKPTGMDLYTSNNVSNSAFAPIPLIGLAYEAVTQEDAAPWPETIIPGTVELPNFAPLTWNFSSTPQDQGLELVHEDHGYAVFKQVKDDVIEIVFQNTVGDRGSASSHGWHLHGHEMYIVGQGVGTFDPDIDPVSYNLKNPVLRDTFSVWNLGWTAIRFKADNPGVWPFHCTMLPHALQGMGFNIITSPDMIPPPPPGAESCYQTSVNPADAQVCTLRSEMTAEDATDGGDGSDGVDISRSANTEKENLSASVGFKARLCIAFLITIVAEEAFKFIQIGL